MGGHDRLHFAAENYFGVVDAISTLPPLAWNQTRGGKASGR